MRFHETSKTHTTGREIIFNHVLILSGINCYDIGRSEQSYATRPIFKEIQVLASHSHRLSRYSHGLVLTTIARGCEMQITTPIILLICSVVTTSRSAVATPFLAKREFCSYLQDGTQCVLPGDRNCCFNQTHLAHCLVGSLSWKISECPFSPCNIDSSGLGWCEMHGRQYPGALSLH